MVRQAVTNSAGRLAAWWSLPDSDGAVMILQACGAWRCVMLARGSGPSFHLATCDVRQVDLV